MLGLVASDMTFVKPTAVKKIQWADLADSEDETTGGASSSWSRAPRLDDAAVVQAACSTNVDTLENNDDCSTDAPSDCADPAEATKNRLVDVASEDETTVDQRVPTEQISYQKDRWVPKPTSQWDGVRSSGRSAGYMTAWQASSWETQAWGNKHSAKEEPRRPARKSYASKKQQGCKKPQCQFIVGIEEDEDFKVKTKLLGPHGKHVKVIAEKSGVKLRLRGRGSGFKEGLEAQESNDPLMLCISAVDFHSYEAAKKLVQELMEDVYKQYNQFCINIRREANPQIRIQLHEGPRDGSA